MPQRSIRRKLIVFFSIMILIILSLFIYILGSAFDYLDIYKNDLIKTSLVQKLGSDIKDNSDIFDSAVKNYSSDSMKEYTESIATVWDSWAQVKNRVDTTQEMFFQIESIRYGLNAYFKSAKVAIIAQRSNQSLFTKETLKANRIEDYISNYIHILTNLRLEESSSLHVDQKDAVSGIRNISFISLGIIGLICLIFSNVFSIRLTKPIVDLANNSKLIAQGKLDVELIKTNSSDEIKTLTQSFNEMSININKMVESLKDKAKIEKQHLEDEVKLINMGKTLKEAQFLSLQSQINPHFLFNTLNTISRTSMFEQATKTVRLIECLSSIFRYNLNNQSKSVSIDTELDILREYMFIQKTRFGERISFNISQMVDTSHIKIPIFSLQPLVENAVKHGIEPKEDGGEISIVIDSDGPFTEVVIKDTGIGFDLNEKTKVNEDRTSIGLINVQRRLALKFGGREDFHIYSRVGEGTTIIIKIPGEDDV